MFTFKVSEKKLSKLEKDYQSYLEHQAQLDDPVVRLERDNKQLRDNIHRLEQENDSLAQDLVSSKIRLRSDMDKVRYFFCVCVWVCLGQLLIVVLRCVLAGGEGRLPEQGVSGPQGSQ